MNQQQRAVVQQALDAFTSSWSTEQEMFKVHDAHMKAIAALRQLLEQPAPVQEPIYQMQMMDGKWIDQAKQSYEYNKAHGNTVRIVYTTLPIVATPLAQPEDKAKRT
jgi:hypothetical protein